MHHFPPLICHNNHFFIHLPADRHWSCFYGFSVMKGAEMTRGVRAALQTTDFVSFVYMPKHHFWEDNSSVVTCWGNTTVLHSFVLTCISTSRAQVYFLHKPHPHAVCCLLVTAIPPSVNLIDLDFYFPDDWWCGTSFHEPAAHFHILIF